MDPSVDSDLDGEFVVGGEVPYRTDKSHHFSMTEASRDYWNRRRWDRAPKGSDFVKNSSLEMTGPEVMATYLSQLEEEKLDPYEELPYNEMEIETLLMVRTWLEYKACNWLDLPLVGKDVAALKAVQDDWRLRIEGEPTEERLARPSPGHYLFLLDRKVRKKGLGYPSPPPLSAPWFRSFCVKMGRIWMHPDCDYFLVDGYDGFWIKFPCGPLASESSESFDDYDQFRYDSPAFESGECFDAYPNARVDVQESDEESDNSQDSPFVSPRLSTLRSANGPMAPRVTALGKKRKRMPDPKLLSRTHGLTADLSYRNRILVTEWALINVSRAGIHRAWAASGIVPYNPSAVLDTLTIEDDVVPETLARKTRLQEKKDIDSMISILQNPTTQAVDKYQELYTALGTAMRANNWKQRSIFADSKRRAQSDDDDEECTAAFNHGGVLDRNAARAALEQEEAAEAELILTKPHACRQCQKRYKTEQGLMKHIQDKHTYCSGRDDACDDSISADHVRPSAAVVIVASKQNRPAIFKVCPICGGNANHKANHAKTRQHRDAVTALQQRAAATQ
jgi:hypothetical protein